MTQTSWLDSHEAAVAHMTELLKQPATKASNLKKVNHLRSLSGDRPLTMTEYLDVMEKSRHGIYPWDEVEKLNLFQRLRKAWKNGRNAFNATMRR